MVTMREQRRKRSREILNYVYREIKVKEEDQEYLLDEFKINDVRKLMTLREEHYKTIQQHSGQGLVMKIHNMVVWIRLYKKIHGNLPTTLVVWKLYFDEEAYIECEIRKVTMEDIAIAEEEGNENVATTEEQLDRKVATIKESAVEENEDVTTEQENENVTTERKEQVYADFTIDKEKEQQDENSTTTEETDRNVTMAEEQDNNDVTMAKDEEHRDVTVENENDENIARLKNVTIEEVQEEKQVNRNVATIEDEDMAIEQENEDIARLEEYKEEKEDEDDVDADENMVNKDNSKIIEDIDQMGECPVIPKQKQEDLLNIYNNKQEQTIKKIKNGINIGLYREIMRNMVNVRKMGEHYVGNIHWFDSRKVLDQNQESKEKLYFGDHQQHEDTSKQENGKNERYYKGEKEKLLWDTNNKNNKDNSRFWRDKYKRIHRKDQQNVSTHRNKKKGKLDVCVKRQTYGKNTWKLMRIIITDDTENLANLAKDREYLEQSKWQCKRTRKYGKHKRKITRMFMNRLKSKRNRNGIKHQLGVRVSRTTKEIMELDAAQ